MIWIGIKFKKVSAWQDMGVHGLGVCNHIELAIGSFVELWT